MIFSRDTSLEADRVMIERLRKVSYGRKWLMVDEQCVLVRSLAWSGLRSRHPEANAAELEERLHDLVLGPVLGPLVLATRRARDREAGEALDRDPH